MSQPADAPLTRRARREQARLERAPRVRGRARATRRGTPAWRSPFALVSITAVAAAIALILVNQKPAPSGDLSALVAGPVSYAGASVDGSALGPADAPVTLEVWSDFQCPVCARFVREQLASLKSELVDAGVLRIVQHDIAILGRGDWNESLELATAAGCAAEQGRYWPYHDLVFWNQGHENRGDHSAEFLAAVADQAGVDRAAWDACVGGDEVRDAVRAATAAAMSAGIHATPTISLNGATPVAGLPDAAALVAQIRALAGAAAGPVASAP